MRKQRKNTREKLRRGEVNGCFEQLSGLLNLRYRVHGARACSNDEACCCAVRV
jgi:hypothetical protein